MEDVFNSLQSQNDDSLADGDDRATNPPAEAAAIGWGVDKDEKDRPGVPHEVKPQPLEHATLLVRQQTDDPTPLIGPNRFLTPVYSTALPTRGLSGLMRKAAYKIPDYKPQRWLLLLAADRVDVIEHTKAGRVALGLGALALAISLIRVARA